MIEILTKRHEVTDVWYEREFNYRDNSNAGFSFPCDEFANVDESKLCKEARKNFIDCLSRDVDVVDLGAVKHEITYMEPIYARCSCGEELHLTGVTLCPRCGRMYNSFGQELDVERALNFPEYGDNFLGD